MTKDNFTLFKKLIGCDYRSRHQEFDGVLQSSNNYINLSKS